MSKMGKLSTEDHEKENANLKDAETAIRELDGKKHSLMAFTLPTGQTLTVGGGPTYFIVELAEDESRRWSVVDSKTADGLIKVVTGGQLTEFPARLCVSIGAAMEAMHIFISTEGKRSERLEWSIES